MMSIGNVLILSRIIPFSKKMFIISLALTYLKFSKEGNNMYVLNEAGFVVTVDPNDTCSIKPCTIHRIAHTPAGTIYVLNIKVDSYTYTTRQCTYEEMLHVYSTTLEGAETLKCENAIEIRRKQLQSYFDGRKPRSCQILRDMLHQLYLHDYSISIPQKYLNLIPHLINFYCTDDYEHITNSSLNKGVEIPPELKKLREKIALLTPRKIYKKTTESITYMNAVCLKFYRFYDRYIENPKYVDKYPVYFINPTNHYQIETCKIDGFVVPTVEEMSRETEKYYIRIKYNKDGEIKRLTLANDEFYHHLFINYDEAMAESQSLKDNATALFNKIVQEVKKHVAPEYRSDNLAIYATYLLSLIYSRERGPKRKLNLVKQFHTQLIQSALCMASGSVS